MAGTPDTNPTIWTPQSEMATRIIVPEFKGKYPELIREGVNPPERHDLYTVLSFEESLQAIEESELKDGEKSPLIGLLAFGGVVEFPGGVGLDYKTPFKTGYIPQYATPAARLMRDTLIATNANLIIAPDIAPLFFAADMSAADGGISIMRIQKDGKHTGSFGFAIPSYTRGGGEPDVIYFDRNTLQDALDISGGELRLFIAEDIIDTGGLLDGAIETVQLMQNERLPIKIVGAGVIVEKTYTQARERINKKIAMPITSAIKVEDLWRQDNSGMSGLKVTGIEYGLTFRKQQAA